MNTEPAHLALAGAASIAYLLICAQAWWRARARRRAAERVAAVHTDSVQAPLLITFASQTGTAEALALQTATALQVAGVNVVLRPLGQLDAATLRSATQVLLIVSTYGEGDAPDPAARFVATVMQNAALDLSSLRFGLLALGDRNYHDFCGFGVEMEQWLQSCRATPLFARIDVDCGDPDALQSWRQQLQCIAAAVDQAAWQDVPFESWTLSARRHLNPGSVGGPVYHLELQPPAGHEVSWQAGDLLQLEVPSDPGRPRDYSIASVPASGAAHLLIRLSFRPDGSAGVASGWLAQEVAIGATLRARLRAHSNFRIGENQSRDLILIGNGTGLAGLRAHLQQRAHERVAGLPVRRNWLIYGERQVAHDACYADELEAWRNDGLLTQLDLVYSRDGGTLRYVQDCLRDQSAALRAWVDGGAALYVCGSLKGMGEGVDAALQQVLGSPKVAQLQQEGRYRRDVY